jgi:hypothetical protein
MDWAILALLAWWLIGVAIVLHEMRMDMDINLGWAMFALLVGILGPIWLWMTLFRLTNDVVLIRKNNRKGKRWVLK